MANMLTSGTQTPMFHGGPQRKHGKSVHTAMERACVTAPEPPQLPSAERQRADRATVKREFWEVRGCGDGLLTAVDVRAVEHESSQSPQRSEFAFWNASLPATNREGSQMLLVQLPSEQSGHARLCGPWEVVYKMNNARWWTQNRLICQGEKREISCVYLQIIKFIISCKSMPRKIISSK